MEEHETDEFFYKKKSTCLVGVFQLKVKKVTLCKQDCVSSLLITHAYLTTTKITSCRLKPILYCQMSCGILTVMMFGYACNALPL